MSKDHTKYVIFDLDGTLANIDHRLHLIKQETPDWTAFSNACLKDKPKKDIIKLLDYMSKEFYIIIVTGRSDLVKTKTILWLKEHNIQYDMLIMRREGEYTPDDELKENWLRTKLPQSKNIFCVFDDRQKVVDMWRRNGLTCLQVAKWEE